MKSGKIYFLILFLIVSISCTKKQSSKFPAEFNSFQELIDHFDDPPPRYRPMAFWSLNGKLEKGELEFQLREFKDKGYGGVFLHPRPGLITEYLSDEWFELCKFVMEKGRELDMETWLYDENSFPSGFAGGHVQDRMPESYNQGIALRMHKSGQIPDSLDQYNVILQRVGDKYNDITSLAHNIKKSGEYILFELVHGQPHPFTAGFPYPDLLMQGVADTFLDATMTGYEKTLGNEFGKLVPGLFTDEPNINRDAPRNAIRWTPDLFDVFEKTWNYSLVEHLPSLIEEVGDWKKIRHNYYQTLLQLFIDRWAKPNYEYCKANNLQWTGHYWEHGWPSPVHGGDNMAMYAWHQTPGIDMLFNTRTERPDQFGNNRAAKELISLANQMGCARTLSETYGASGYELNFEDMTRNGNWQYALGVNLMTQHLSYYSIQGTRKYDFPQTFSYHAPFWEHYKVQNDYFGRLSLALAAGQQINKILVIEPTTSAWMYFSKFGSNKRFEEIGNKFDDFIDELEMLHIEYDIGCENIIKDHGRAENGKFVINKRKYDRVILPPGIDNLDFPTVQVLKHYLEQGGEVISFEHEITRVDGAETTEISDLRTKHKNLWQLVQSLTDVQNELAPAGFSVSMIRNGNGELYHHRRKFKDGHLIFFTNFSLNERSRAEIYINEKYLYFLDVMSGDIFTHPVKQINDWHSFKIEIQPGEGKLFFATDVEYDFETGPPKIDGLSGIRGGGETEIRRLSPNILALDYCNLSVNGETYSGINYYDAAMETYRQHGFERGNPWTVAVQFKSTLVEADTFPPESGFGVEYPFFIENDFDDERMKSLQLVVEFPHLYQVFINENQVRQIPGEWWLSHENGVYNIGEFVKTGRNAVKLICRPMSIYAEIEPVFIRGDFAVVPAEPGFIISDPQKLTIGSWQQIGLPMYCEVVEYTRTWEIAKKDRYYLQLGKWSGTVAEVIVNGKSAGLIFNEPYLLEISEFLEKGKNTISVRVTGSLKNILGPFHQEQREGIVTPWSWKYPPKEQPAGNDYSLIDYGLYEEFNVWEALEMNDNDIKQEIQLIQ